MPWSERLDRLGTTYRLAEALADRERARRASGFRSLLGRVDLGRRAKASPGARFQSRSQTWKRASSLPLDLSAQVAGIPLERTHHPDSHHPAADDLDGSADSRRRWRRACRLGARRLGGRGWPASVWLVSLAERNRRGEEADGIIAESKRPVRRPQAVPMRLGLVLSLLAALRQFGRLRRRRAPRPGSRSAPAGPMGLPLFSRRSRSGIGPPPPDRRSRGGAQPKDPTPPLEAELNRRYDELLPLTFAAAELTQRSCSRQSSRSSSTTTRRGGRTTLSRVN